MTRVVSVDYKAEMQLLNTGSTPADSATSFYCPLLMHLPPLLWILFALPFFPPVSLPTCLMCVREENEAAEIIPACVFVCVWRVFNIAAQLTDSLFSLAAITHLCLCLSASACRSVRHALWTPTQPLAVRLWGSQVVVSHGVWTLPLFIAYCIAYITAGTSCFCATAKTM